jgi:hypothetical protein
MKRSAGLSSIQVTSACGAAVFDGAPAETMLVSTRYIVS